jgi:hypothetical protein
LEAASQPEALNQEEKTVPIPNNLDELEWEKRDEIPQEFSLEVVQDDLPPLSYRLRAFSLANWRVLPEKLEKEVD